MEIGLITGFKFNAVAAGIKHEGSTRLDLGLVVADRPAAVAAVTTTNLVHAAPVAITRERVSKGVCSAVLVNSGNANAYTGQKGMRDALALCAEVATCLGVGTELVIPLSTGVIGNPLPTERILRKITELAGNLRPDGLMDVARAIMTTDTRPKTVSLSAESSIGPIKMVGTAKGAGMIAPNMATMLSVILTDVRVEPSCLKEALLAAAEGSFNAITIDGDTSTNDTLVVMAGGSSDSPRLPDTSRDRETFSAMLYDACLDLARQIVRDGEGVTKVVTVRVCGAADKTSAARVARTIAESLLVKTAFHGEDPNWGRLVCAAGRSGIAFDPDQVDLFIGDVQIVRQGTIVPDDWESPAHEVMKRAEFSVSLDLRAGNSEAEILTADLSKEYVSINADYRS